MHLLGVFFDGGLDARETESDVLYSNPRSVFYEGEFVDVPEKSSDSLAVRRASSTHSDVNAFSVGSLNETLGLFLIGYSLLSLLVAPHHRLRHGQAHLRIQYAMLIEDRFMSFLTFCVTSSLARCQQSSALNIQDYRIDIDIKH